MTPPRVAPPEELRDRDWHSQNLIERLDAATEGAKLRRWPEHVTLLRTTASHIAALRAERDDQAAAATGLSADMTVFAQRCDALAEERDAAAERAKALADELARSTHHLAIFVRDSRDPGTDALASLLCARELLHAYRAASPKLKP